MSISEEMQLFMFVFVVCCVTLYALAFFCDYLFHKRDLERRKGLIDFASMQQKKAVTKEQFYDVCGKRLEKHLKDEDEK